MTILDQCGFEARHTMCVSGHKSETSIQSYTSKTAHDTKLAMSNGLSNAIGKSPSVSTISKKIMPEKEPFQGIQNTENKTVMIDSSTTSKSQFSFYNCSVNILNQCMKHADSGICISVYSIPFTMAKHNHAYNMYL